MTVRLLALPDGALTTATRKALHAIRRVLDNVVLIRRMHQKILIVDDRWSFVGSMNLLSHGPTPSRRRHEVMVEFENRHFAEQLLENERARQLATPPSCPLCHTRFSEVKHVRRGKEGWYWICAGECRGSTAFVDAKVRLDWRPTSS